MSLLRPLCLIGLIFVWNTGSESYGPPSKIEEATVTRTVQADANACETNSSFLDALTKEARTSSERVFVISRLGAGEKRTIVSRSRLQMARNHLVTSGRLQKEQVVFAEGERVIDKGRLEFYIGSRLYLISLAQRNGDICLTCCNDRLRKSH